LRDRADLPVTKAVKITMAMNVNLAMPLLLPGADAAAIVAPVRLEEAGAARPASSREGLCR